MAKHSKQATRGNDRQSWPAWIWLAVGVLLGLALSAVVLVKDWAPILRKKNFPQPNAEAIAPLSENETAVADEKSKSPAHKTYDFYQVLPEMEVVIPDAELSAKAKAEQQARAQAQTTPGTTPNVPATPSVQPGTHYFLQAGSYPDPKAADEVKAKLALSGFTAKVQPVTINGRTWHRVRLGPYGTASELETAKRGLTDNGINAVALKEAAGQ